MKANREGLLDKNASRDGAVSLEQFHTTTSINLAKNRRAAALEGLVNLLQTNTRVTELSLEEISLNNEKLNGLRDVLEHHPSITALNAGNNKITQKGVIQISAILSRNSTLRKLNLMKNEVGVAGASSIATALATNTSLEVLYLGHCKIGSRGASLIGSAIESNKSVALRALHLQYNNIGGKGVKDLFSAVSSNSMKLRKLDLTGNAIGTSEIKLVSQVLLSNSALKSLNLSSCSLGDKGVEMLLPGLKENSTLITLRLSYNGITDKGAVGLIVALAENEKASIRNLYLDGNRISYSGMSLLEAGITTCISLEKVCLDNNQAPKLWAVREHSTFKKVDGSVASVLRDIKVQLNAHTEDRAFNSYISATKIGHNVSTKTLHFACEKVSKLWPERDSELHSICEKIKNSYYWSIFHVIFKDDDKQWPLPPEMIEKVFSYIKITDINFPARDNIISGTKRIKRAQSVKGECSIDI